LEGYEERIAPVIGPSTGVGSFSAPTILLPMLQSKYQGRLTDELKKLPETRREISRTIQVIKDNPVVSVLLSLVEFAVHPGDTFAWRHLQMSRWR
jgi:hypothetical protein